MDIYALNNWDATIYVYGINLVNLLYGSPVWKAIVAITSVYAFFRFFPEIKDSPNIPGQLIKRALAVFLFSALTLWPTTWTIDIYTISKAKDYTNVFKWVVPVNRSDSFTADLYLSAEAKLPAVVGFVGQFIGDLQFWTMWLIDKAGRTLGTDTVGKGLMHTAKLMTLEKEISQGIDTVVAELRDKGQWTPQDQQKLAELNSALRDFLAQNCVSPSVIEDVWQKATSDGPGDVLPMLLDNINDDLDSTTKQSCQELASEIKSTVSNICERWSSVTGDPSGVCSSMVEVSLMQKLSNFFHSAVNSIKSFPEKGVEAILSILKDLLVGFFLGAAGLANFVLLAGITTIAPISLGITNLLIFFLSPLFFLTQLVQGQFVTSTVRIILEMLWARLLYAVFILAYVIVCVLQGPAWKELIGVFGLSGSFLNTPVMAELLAKRLGALILKASGVGILAAFFSYTAITLAAGMIVLWFGAQMLRTIIFGEFLHITQVISAGKDFVQNRARIGLRR
ncbi:hypothetical protein Theam_1781 (plasmid) [Thermovibrio ammonificans HB-1]|uniref:Uncharacterized protein n=1 Tax=Thermovibrio ammonificans (strain DSM 15698 / JCM 12110 / HB-1) TaxID=648996 RepID=E8T6R4_THEA1|nr:hypothetical protein [Thermovibrio ammonificans]ADU97737.1 hypothetical protein Theam_1781 [Thermovibrio ammonificans HB-1]